MRLKIHPLFFAFGFYYALTSRIFEFVVCTLTAVIHELGHSAVAGELGYKLDKIVLMPFGAVVKGDIDGLKLKDEIKIALAGPITNIAVGLLFLACWWVVPETYAFTDIAAYSNFSMAIINLIPAYPLDGGRVIHAGVSMKRGRKTARRVCVISGLTFTAVLTALFFISLKGEPNFSILFFGAFVFCGIFMKEDNNGYIRIYKGITESMLARGVPVKRQAISKSVTVKRLISILDENSVNEIAVYDGEREVALLTQSELEKVILSRTVYDKLEDCI